VRAPTMAHGASHAVQIHLHMICTRSARRRTERASVPRWACHLQPATRWGPSYPSGHSPVPQSTGATSSDVCTPALSLHMHERHGRLLPSD
jgi:hypothetical protein